MKIKALFIMVLCALLAVAAVSCSTGDMTDLPSANAPQDSTATNGAESTPITAPTQESMKDPSGEVQTEISAAPLCEHVFEEDICTLCGSDTTALFLFSKQTSLTSEEYYTIIGTQGTLPSVLIVPETYHGNPITGIASHAIKNSDTLTDLTIPDSLSIADAAIENCPNLSTLRLSLYSLPTNYFMDRYFDTILDKASLQNLTTVYVSSETKKLFEAVFSGCDRLENIYLPAELKEVEAFVFSSCTSLKNIVVDENNPYFYVENNCLISKANKRIVAAGTGAIIPDDGSVTAIGRGAFSGLDLYKELVIPDCIKEIGFHAFYGWNSLEKLTIPFLGFSKSDNEYTGGYLGVIFGANDSSKNADFVPESLREVTVTGGNVNMNAFEDCKYLTDINLEGVISIKYTAFSGCKKLQNLHLGKKLQSFVALPSGVNITVDEENPYLSLREDGTFYNKEGTKIILANKNTVLPTDGTLLEIGESAFAGCQLPETLIIPDSVTLIGKNAFKGCLNIRELTLPSSVTDIKEGAFAGCTKLTRVYGGQNLEWIGASAFEGCTGLLTVETMPAIKGVSQKAFYGCRNLRAVPWDETAFQLKTIAEAAFGGCEKITTVVLPETVSILGKTAFMGCTSLEAVEFSSKIKTIPVSCFEGCTALCDVTFKEGLQAIEYGAFYECKNLNEVILPNSLVTLDQITFSGIKTLHIGSGLTEVCHNSFPGSIETITLSEGNSHFYLSSGSLVDAETEVLVWGNGRDHMLTFDRPFKAIGDYAFYGRTNVYAITLPEGCEAVGKSAFAYCSKLVEVNFPSTLKSIFYDTFNKCPVYDDMVIPKGVEILK